MLSGQGQVDIAGSRKGAHQFILKDLQPVCQAADDAVTDSLRRLQEDVVAEARRGTGLDAGEQSIQVSGVPVVIME